MIRLTRAGGIHGRWPKHHRRPVPQKKERKSGSTANFLRVLVDLPHIHTLCASTAPHPPPPASQQPPHHAPAHLRWCRKAARSRCMRQDACSRVAAVARRSSATLCRVRRPRQAACKRGTSTQLHLTENSQRVSDEGHIEERPWRAWARGLQQRDRRDGAMGQELVAAAGSAHSAAPRPQACGNCKHPAILNPKGNRLPHPRSRYPAHPTMQANQTAPRQLRTASAPGCG